MGVPEQIERLNEFPSQWHEIAQPGHFWFEWRFLVFLDLVKSLDMGMHEAVKALDVGCGHGLVRRQMEKVLSWTIDGIDLDNGVLEKNMDLRGETFIYDVHERRSALKEKYDVILLFDVLEHIRDVRSFLNSVIFHLRKGGILFVNVPALNGLLGPFDRVVGHLRRYNMAALRTDLMTCELKILEIHYWGFSMLPLLVLRKLIDGDEGSTSETIRRGLKPPTLRVNRWLKSVMRMETMLVKKPFLGTSLFTAAAKAW